MGNLKDIRESTLDSLRAEYYVLTERLAGIDAEIELLQKRREIVSNQRDTVNAAAIRLLAELEGGE